MRFVRVEILWFLLALPPLAVIGWWSARLRRGALQRFAGGAFRRTRFDTEVSSHRRAVKLLLLYLALTCGIVAAARPQWGSRLEPVTRRGADVVIVVDTSLSMAAEDLAPNRLMLARHGIDALLQALSGDRVALVSFAGQATLACPLTLDHAAVRLFLETLEPEVTQVPGTALAEALRLAVAAFGDDEPGRPQRSRALLLFTDGEDHEGGIDEVLPELQRAGAVVIAVGCGTERGGLIPLRLADGTVEGYKKDRQGRVVTTQLEPAVLEQLALETGGGYYQATTSGLEIEEIAKALNEMDSAEFGSVLRARYEERFQIPLVIAVVALLAEMLIGDRRRASAA